MYMDNPARSRTAGLPDTAGPWPPAGWRYAREWLKTCVYFRPDRGREAALSLLRLPDPPHLHPDAPTIMPAWAPWEAAQANWVFAFRKICPWADMTACAWHSISGPD